MEANIMLVLIFVSCWIAVSQSASASHYTHSGHSVHSSGGSRYNSHGDGRYGYGGHGGFGGHHGYGHGYGHGGYGHGGHGHYHHGANIITLDNGWFGYNPNDLTYGQPRKHNAKRGYYGYGNLINNGHDFGLQYGVIARAGSVGYETNESVEELKDLNTFQLPYYEGYFQ